MKTAFLSPEDVGRLKAKCVGFSKSQFDEYLSAVERYQLDPFSRQIYGILRNSKGKKILSVQTGIDGYRLIADRTGKYAGSDDPIFEGLDTTIKPNRPNKVTVTVYKMVDGVRVGFSCPAWWDEYYPGDGASGMFWRAKPHVMLAKCAEAGALRKGYPGELSGLYVDAEMDNYVDFNTPQRTGNTAIIGKGNTTKLHDIDFMEHHKKKLSNVNLWKEFDEIRDKIILDAKRGELTKKDVGELASLSMEKRGMYLADFIGNSKCLSDLEFVEDKIDNIAFSPENKETLLACVKAKKEELSA